MVNTYHILHITVHLRQTYWWGFFGGLKLDIEIFDFDLKLTRILEKGTFLVYTTYHSSQNWELIGFLIT